MAFLLPLNYFNITNIERSKIMKKSRGRPSMGKHATIHTNCKAYVKTFIKRLGKGNMSMGLEILVDKEKARLQMLKLTDTKEKQDENHDHN
jgi:hypothetical protein